jgi:hypothetical protein
MSLIVLDPIEYPLKKGEKWFYVHPNDVNLELFIPAGAAAVCKNDLIGIFSKNTPYRIVNYDSTHGWVSVSIDNEKVYKMPVYLFARHFDAEAFVVNRSHTHEQTFRYKPNHKVWSD